MESRSDQLLWLVKELGFTNKAMKAVYVAIEGRPTGLPLFEAMFMLGRESSLRRLRAARAKL